MKANSNKILTRKSQTDVSEVFSPLYFSSLRICLTQESCPTEVLLLTCGNNHEQKQTYNNFVCYPSAQQHIMITKKKKKKRKESENLQEFKK